MAVEREIKLRFASAEEAGAHVVGAALGAAPLRARRLQQDCLLDTEQLQLTSTQSVLRVRREAGGSVLTFKGPVQPGPMKVRDELETAVADGHTLLQILGTLGFRVWFRYEKYREEFSAAGVTIAIDETPIGVFVEIEGDEHAIHVVAGALDRRPDEYVTDSYRTLFLHYCRARGIAPGDMTFAAITGGHLAPVPSSDV
jgi:adenylate cyclase, class 2